MRCWFITTLVRIFFHNFIKPVTFTYCLLFAALSDDASSDLMETVTHSDTDNEWMEQSSEDEEHDNDEESDVDMST